MNNAMTIWLTGLSGAGKSTLALEINKILLEKGVKVEILDGDVVRNEIGHMFGYSREERMKMSKVIRFISKTLNKNNISVIVAAIAPFQEMRDLNRQEIDNYVEVYVNCPVDECIRRDTKGLYKKALQGEVRHVVGIDDVYEIPQSYDIELRTDQELIDESVRKLKEYFDRRLAEG
ncbi:adenylyl-sulfate kinase [Cohnella yongneupensis]|uniref:Adenylyl-sulfate kinase n=1 Tax=Cohnella yongneupensis TaxID=425006 RepID=A0ABW0QVF0_9BACL